MKAACLFSGGKDSLYAAAWALNQGFDVRLLTVFPKEDSLMFHHPNVRWTSLQAERMGLQLITVSADKGDEMETLKKALSAARPDMVVSGAIASEYQKSRIDLLCEELGMRSIAPLWRKDELMLLREMVSEGFEIIIVSISAEGLGQEWLGRKIDETAIGELEDLRKSRGINISGEGGEFETFVLNCPLFSKPLAIEKSKKGWDGARGRLVIERTS